jgi:hypothetical protein
MGDYTLNELAASVENLSTLVDSVKQLDMIAGVAQTFRDPGGLGGAMTCGEANAFVDLLDALGLPHHAEDLRKQHAEAEDLETAQEMHDHWGLDLTKLMFETVADAQAYAAMLDDESDDEDDFDLRGPESIDAG